MGTTWRRRLVYKNINGTQRFYKAYIPKKRAEQISDTVDFFSATIQHAKNFLHICNNSYHTGFNLCTIESITNKPTSKIWKSTQGRIETPSGNINNSNPPIITYEGDSHGNRWALPVINYPRIW